MTCVLHMVTCVLHMVTCVLHMVTCVLHMVNSYWYIDIQSQDLLPSVAPSVESVSLFSK